MGGLYWSGCPIRGGYLPSPVNTQTPTLSKLTPYITECTKSYELIRLDSLGLAHLGLERKGGKTGAWWDRGRGQDEDPSDWPDGQEQEIAPEMRRGLAAAADYSRKREWDRERSGELRHVRVTSHGIWCRCLYLRGVLWGKIAGLVVAVWFPVRWRRGSRLLAVRKAQLHHHHSTRRGRRRHCWKSQHRFSRFHYTLKPQVFDWKSEVIICIQI